MATQIGRYEILEELGRGGMGLVLHGNDPLMKREVAIKLMSNIGDPEMLARFQNEAASAGRLRHENIVTIYDFGEERGVPYIVMEHLKGMDLQKVLSKKIPLTLLEKLRILCQVAVGLQVAHEAGIIHRDVKPANIMVLPDKSVKIMDFGIARASGNATRHTRTGLMVGTLAYLPPEQFEGAPADAFSDMWAYGVIAYQLLAGKNPLEGPDDNQVIYRITVGKIPDIAEYAPDLPEDLRGIVNRLLQRQRINRYQSFEDVRIELNIVLERLEQQDAARLVDQARVTAARGDLNAAIQTLRQVLEKHPSNVAARQLREQLMSQVRTQEAKQQVRELVQTGDAELAAGRFEEAAAKYAEAVRILPGDATCSIRLERAKELAVKAKKTRTELSRARGRMAEGQLEQALDIVESVLNLDPANEEGRVLADQIRDSLRQRQEARLAEAILRARTLSAQRQFDSAKEVLDSCFVDIGENPALTQAMEDVRREAAEYEAETEVAGAINNAHEKMQLGKFAEVVEILRPIAARYPANAQVKVLMDNAEAGLARERQNATREREMVRQRETREREIRDRATREREMREKEARERQIREQEAREQAAREQEARDKEAREKELRDQEARDKESREREAREKEAREREAREREQTTQETPSILALKTSEGLIDQAKVISKALAYSRDKEKLGDLKSALHVLDVALSRLPNQPELLTEKRRLQALAGQPGDPGVATKPQDSTKQDPKDSGAAAKGLRETNLPSKPGDRSGGTRQAGAGSGVLEPPVKETKPRPEPPPPPPPPPPSGPNKLVIGGVAAAVVLGGLIVYKLVSGSGATTEPPKKDDTSIVVVPKKDDTPKKDNTTADVHKDDVVPKDNGTPKKDDTKKDDTKKDDTKGTTGPILTGATSVHLEYTKGGAPPANKEIPIGRASFYPSARNQGPLWLKATKDIGQVLVGVIPTALATLTPNDYKGTVIVTSGNETAKIDVTLTVKPEIVIAGKKDDTKKGGGDTLGGNVTAPGCTNATWMLDKEGEATWSGSLYPGERVTLGTNSATPPKVNRGWNISDCAKDISIQILEPKSGITVATPNNPAARVVFTNSGSSPVTTIRFHWSFKM